MKIKIVATGDHVHLERQPIVDALVKAGIFEYASATTPAPRPPCNVTWAITFSEFSLEHYALASCDVCGDKFPIFNPTERAAFAHGGKVNVIPAEMFAEYKKKKERVPTGKGVVTAGKVHFV
jgi:hypothetical protein